MKTLKIFILLMALSISSFATEKATYNGKVSTKGTVLESVSSTFANEIKAIFIKNNIKNYVVSSYEVIFADKYSGAIRINYTTDGHNKRSLVYYRTKEKSAKFSYKSSRIVSNLSSNYTVKHTNSAFTVNRNTGALSTFTVWCNGPCGCSMVNTGPEGTNTRFECSCADCVLYLQST